MAGSISTLEDCYSPELVPPDDECRAEHSERVHHLIESGVDLFLLETFNTIREAVIAAKLATVTGTPVIVSFVCNREGRILSGEIAERSSQPVAAAGRGCPGRQLWADAQPARRRWPSCVRPVAWIFP